MAWEVGHPLKRDGTSQRQRPLPALLPENNPIDPRSVEEGLVYAYRLAEKITYFNAENTEEGDWRAFFPGEDPAVLRQLLRERKEPAERNVAPQHALFITFLKLLDLLKADLNGLTQKHLAFYYEEVLGFERKPAQPDQVHVLFQLAKQKTSERIAAGTYLLAGKDAEKKPLYYRLRNEIVVNTAQVKKVRSVKGQDASPTAAGEEITVPASRPFAPFGKGGPNQVSNLLIGLEELVTDSQLNLLFQVVEGSAPLSDGLEPGDVRWSVRREKKWVSLSGEDIVRDTTLSLQQSGIITFSFHSGNQPRKEDTDTLYWIRASITKDADNASRMINVQAQAAIAEFEDHHNAPSHFAQSLPPNTIKNLQERNTDIRGVKQPYGSFGGAPREQDRSFFARVSERLRHKQRAITIWDVEHMVLSTFDDVYKVKCVNHTGRNKEDFYSEFQPGMVEVVIIPKIKTSLEPKAINALLKHIKLNLEKLQSPFVDLRVSNPRYEAIRLDFKVAFKDGFDAGFYTEMLNDTIRRYLSPWAFEEGADLVFGGKIYRSKLLAFIENLDYVEHVNEFKMYYLGTGAGIGEMKIIHDFRVGAAIGYEVEIAEASTATSILVSANNHDIQVLQPDEYPCNDSALCNDGIGCMLITLDLIIGKN